MHETATLSLPRRLPRPSRRALLIVIAAVAVAGLIGSRTSDPTPAVRGAAAGSAPGAGSGTTGPSGAGGGGALRMSGTAFAQAGQTGGTATAGGAGGVAAAAPAPSASATDAVGAPSTISDSSKIVKTGSIEIGVGKGTLQRTLDSVTTTAAGMGGYVASAQTSGSTTGDERAAGSLVARVPAAQFEQLLSQVRGMGDVHSVTTAGQDVTAQFADINARINALTATRDQLLTIMGSATAVQDVLSVQDRLTGVQAQLDSLIGQQKVLADQADLATLTVNALEPGAELAAAPVDTTWTFGDAFRDARHRFADGLKDVIAGSGTLALGVLGLAIAYAVYVVARRRRPASPATVEL